MKALDNHLFLLPVCSLKMLSRITRTVKSVHRKKERKVVYFLNTAHNRHLYRGVTTNTKYFLITKGVRAPN
jgi:hypothetical protein